MKSMTRQKHTYNFLWDYVMRHMWTLFHAHSYCLL